MALPKTTTRPKIPKPHWTTTGKIVYYRKPRPWTLKGVIRVLGYVEFEFWDILLVRKMIEDLWDALRKFFEGVLVWVRRTAGLILVKWILKFMVGNYLTLLRNFYPWGEEDLEAISTARDLIEGL